MPISKKVFIASTSLLAVVFLFWGIYGLSFKKPVMMENPAGNNITRPAASTAKSDAKITAISDEAVLSPVFSGDAIKYYSKTTGKAYAIDFLGNSKRTLSTKELLELSSIDWSPDTLKVISSSQKNGLYKFYYYDYKTNYAVPLVKNIDAIVWQNNNKIFYKYYDPKTKKATLNISDPDGKNWNTIAPLGHVHFDFSPVPRTGLASFWNSPDAFYETSFQSVPIIGGEVKVLLSGKFGADYLWSPSGNQFLVSHSDQKGGAKTQLAIANDRGGEYKNLEIPTFVSKCSWSKDNKTVYYALPGGMPENAILPNDYLNGKFNSTDTFWKIDTSTGEKTRIVDLGKISGRFDATHPFLNADESMLFFVNRIDGKLYRIDL